MFYMFAALVAAIIGVIPLLLKRKRNSAITQGIITFAISYGLIYLINPSTVYPLFGFPGFLILLWWGLAALIDGIQEEGTTSSAFFPAGAVALYVIVFVFGSGFFRASDYASMIGVVEQRKWDQDVQPKDPAHMRMSTKENAIYQAKKVLGTDGAIGSQFEISEDSMTLQMIHGELWYVVPLDYSGFGVWMNAKGSPGYIKIHGEDPHRQPELVLLKEGGYMRYTPNAFFSDNLERHLRNNGYLNKELGGSTFEIDEEGNAWWVVIVMEPTIAWSGDHVLGVAIVDPVSGVDTFYQLGKIPEWVDRAVPEDVVKNYLEWQGEYSGGWLNSWWGSANLTKPESPNLVYGNGGQPEWVTGITSKSSKDDSLVALVYTNSRTGKSVRYVMQGGATDTAILSAVDKNQNVQFKHLHGVAPQLYNVYGVATSVVPLLNDNHAYQGVAMGSHQRYPDRGRRRRAIRSNSQLRTACFRRRPAHRDGKGAKSPDHRRRG